MVLEYFGLLNSYLNGFFSGHILLISHMFAAVFLVLTETTINLRIITPVIDELEGMMLGSIPLLPTLVTAFMFMVWATASIYVYQYLFQWVLSKYQSVLTLLIIGIFVLITIAVNIKYRD